MRQAHDDLALGTQSTLNPGRKKILESNQLIFKEIGRYHWIRSNDLSASRMRSNQMRDLSGRMRPVIFSTAVGELVRELYL